MKTISEKYINDDDWFHSSYEKVNYGIIKPNIDPNTTKEDFIKYFKEHPEILQDVIVALRKDKIEKIMKK
jgi:hypothetical protein